MSRSEEPYIFDAPQFVDFTNPDEVVDAAGDKWFGQFNHATVVSTVKPHSSSERFDSLNSIVEEERDDGDDSVTRVEPGDEKENEQKMQHASNKVMKTTTDSSSDSLAKEKTPRKTGKRSITVPKPFNFVTPKRARGANFQEQLKSKSKAQHPGQNISGPGTDGALTRKRKRCKSQPRSEELSKKRKGQVEDSIISKPDQYRFHAHRVPKYILKKRVGIPSPKPKPLTDPVSPALNTRSRTRVIEQPAEDKQHILAHPLKDHSAPFQPNIEHKKTVIQPFSFDQKITSKLAEQKEVEESSGQSSSVQLFTANRMPFTTVKPAALPVVPKRPSTVPHPFALHADVRGKAYQQKFQEQLLEEAKAEREKAKFHAQDADILYQPPFVPTLSEEHQSITHSPKLHTEERARIWQKLEEEQKVKQEEQDKSVAKLSAERQEKEEKEIRKLRSDLVMKAQLI